MSESGDHDTGGACEEGEAEAHAAGSTRLRTQTRDTSDNDTESEVGGKKRTERLGNFHKPPTDEATNTW